MSLLLGAGTKILGGVFGAKDENKRNDENRVDRRQESIAEFLRGIFQNDQQDRLSRAGLGLQSTQMNPFMPAQSRFSQDLRRQFAGGARPFRLGGGGDQLDTSSVSAANLDRDAQNFYTQVASANPFAPTGGGDAVEAYRQSQLEERKRRQQQAREEVLAALNEMGQSSTVKPGRSSARLPAPGSRPEFYSSIR